MDLETISKIGLKAASEGAEVLRSQFGKILNIQKKNITDLATNADIIGNRGKNMSKTFNKRTLDDHLECYGNFNKTDPICTRLCAINLRCAIEGDEQDRMEILEDLVASEVMFMKIQ